MKKQNTFTVMSERHARRIIQPRESIIVACLNAALEALATLRHLMPNEYAVLGAGHRGVFMHDIATDAAKRLFNGTGVATVCHQQVVLFDFTGGLFLRFKQPPFIDGTHDVVIKRDQAWLIPGLREAHPECATIVEAEYKLDASATQFQHIAIACRVERKTKWSFPLQAPATPNVDPQTSEAAPTGVRVRAINKRSSAGK